MREKFLEKEESMFDVRLVSPPNLTAFTTGKFRTRGEFRMIHRFRLSKHQTQQYRHQEEFQHEIVVGTLQALENLPFQGRIGVAVHHGSVFMSGNIETWNQGTEFEIDRILMDLEVFLTQFARQHPGFRQTIAVSYFPEVYMFH